MVVRQVTSSLPQTSSKTPHGNENGVEARTVIPLEQEHEICRLFKNRVGTTAAT